MPDAPEDGSDSGNDSEDNDSQLEIPDAIKDLIDEEVVTPLSGNGTEESPLQLDVNNVSLRKMNDFLNKFTTFEFKILKIEELDNKTKIDILITKKTTRSKLTEEIHLTFIVEKENSELVQAIKDFAEIKDEDNSTDNNPDNGEVKPEEKPEVPEETPDVKPEEKPEAPEVPEQSPEAKPEAPEIPNEIKDLIDTEVVTAVSGNGTKESPLQLDVNNVSSTKVNEFLNNFNQFDFKVLKVEIIGDKTKFEVMLSRKISLTRLNNDIDFLNDDIYLSLMVESKNTELVQKIKDFAQIKDENNSTDNINPDNGEMKP